MSYNSGFGEVLEEILIGIFWIIDLEDLLEWVKVIKGVWKKGSKIVLNEC